MRQQPPRQHITSWQEAEQNAVRWMRFWGIDDASVTRGGADAGIDIYSGQALAQVKYEAHHVGRPALHRLVGARGRDHGKPLFFFTGTGYSSAAIQYAQEMEIALFQYGVDGAMAAVNAPAKRFVQQARERHEPQGAGKFNDLRSLEARLAGLTSTQRQTAPPLPPGARRLIAGCLTLVWFVWAALKDQNHDEPSDIVPMIVIGGGSLVLGIALVISGARRLRGPGSD